ncbi:glycerol-3-phosphate 1-O-acyltransferase PlsY [Liberibacter sp. Z1]|nr:glycerol-3-phosphate 1-O-acyltransferase PlsY [Candidatus Liberibacter sp.]
MSNLQFSSYNLSEIIISISLGYFFGSIPFGLLLTRISGLEDIRQVGSGNIGATNVLRTGNKTLALITLILDAIKATFSVVLVSILFGRSFGELAGFLALIGHTFPIWLKFKGGKGVATCIGALFALNPYFSIIFAIVWISCFLKTRYSSSSSLIATLITTITIWITTSETNLAVMFTLMTAIIYLKHISNIQRLIKGLESKIVLVKNKNDKF